MVLRKTVGKGAVWAAALIVGWGGGPSVHGLNQEGMSYASWWPGEYASTASGQSLDNLRSTGAEWVSLIVTRYQTTIDATAIVAAAGTPTDADLIHVIQWLHDRGMRVMLKPHLDLSNDPGHWRGQIGENFGDEAAWQSWFSSYTAFVRYYAQLARIHGVDQFCVGTELEATVSREADWRAVIADVRGQYGGPLVYAANWNGYGAVPFWDALDFIGVDAYFPVAADTAPTVEGMTAAWQPHLADLASLSTLQHKPVIFTEIGYVSRDGAAREPWRFDLTTAVDLQEQSDAYRAVAEAVAPSSWLEGIYWWVWSPDPGDGGVLDGGFSPWGKPAELVLRDLYRDPPSPAVADSRVAAYPNPFRRSSSRATLLGPGVLFDRLAPGEEVRIHTVAGVLVRTLRDEDGDGRVLWDATDDRGERAASGVYFFLSASGNGGSVTSHGKIAVLN